jgi:hypothetical protein
MESLVDLLFNVVITLSSFLFSSSPCCLFFHGFPICPEQKIYWNIDLFKSLWNYLSNVRSLIKNEVQTRELFPFYFSAACCPELISGRAALGDSGITSCRNLRLSWFLICWNCNFVVLLTIQKYLVFPLRDHAEFWWDRWLLAHWSGDVNDLDHSIFYSAMLHFRVEDSGSPPCLSFV